MSSSFHGMNIKKAIISGCVKFSVKAETLERESRLFY